MTFWLREFQVHTGGDGGHVRRLPSRRGAAPPRRLGQRVSAAHGSRAVAPVLGAIVALLFYVSQSAASTQASYEINALQGEQVRLIAEQENLMMQLAQARGASRVNASAAAFGLSHPERWEYLPAASQAIALSRDQAPPARQSPQAVLTAVLAVLTGSPAVAEASSR